MGIHLEICNSGKSKPRNTGENEQCFEGILEKIFVAKKNFRFANLQAMKDVSVWKTAIQNKDIVPLYNAYEVAPANIEAKKFESGNFSYETAKAIKKTTFECFLGFCSHRALKTYANSEYTQVFELTDTGVILGVNTSDGSIKGQDVSIAVDIRTIQVSGKVPFTKVTLTYRDYEELEDGAVGIKPTWDTETQLQGIFDLNLEQVSATATTIRFKALAGCSGGGALVTSLVAANIVVKNAVGQVQTVSFVAADPDGIYTVTGTGFAAGFTISLNGVVAQTTIMYESPEPLTITI
ncbi:MAG TPA: hypothetical protein VF677_11845 [Flavobacterium sp.]|jgi:hypothetical protein